MALRTSWLNENINNKNVEDILQWEDPQLTPRITCIEGTNDSDSSLSTDSVDSGPDSISD